MNRESGTQLPAVAADVVESAVLLAKAEVKLAMAETREVVERSVSAIAWVLICGFLLQAAVGLLVLGPLLTAELSVSGRSALLIVPVILAATSGYFAFRSVKKVTEHGKQ